MIGKEKKKKSKLSELGKSWSGGRRTDYVVITANESLFAALQANSLTI